MSIRLKAAAVSDVGPQRSSNQDAAFAASWGAAVADGVGGGPSGDLASAALLHRLVAGVESAIDAEGLAIRIREANWDLRAHVERDPNLRGMATTFTGLFLGADGSLLLAHTGDSRAYLSRGDWFTRETRDDSYVQALVDHGLIAPEAAASHPRRNIITASLGGGEEDVVSVAERTPEIGDRWLLCSDGLSDYISELEIAEVLRAGSDPGAVAADLVARAIEEGTLDNVTVVVVDILDDDGEGRVPVFSGSAAQFFAEDVETA